MLTVGHLVPAQQPLGVVGEPVATVGDGPDPGLVDPAAEVGRRRHVRGAGDHARRGVRGVARKVGQQPSEGGLRRDRLAVGVAQRGGNVQRCRRRDGLTPQRRAALLTESTGSAVRREPLPRGAPFHTGVGRQDVHLFAAEQGRVVVRVALGRQPAALDRVREHHGRAVGRDGGEGVDEQTEVVPSEVADRRRQLGGGHPGHEGTQRIGFRSAVGVGHDPLGDVRGVDPQHPLVLLVGHALQPFPEQLATGPGEDVRDEPAPLEHDDLPSGGSEHPLELGDLDVGHHPVQRLPVEVDHPEQLAQPSDLWIHHGLPDRALVQLGVPEEADEAPRRGCRGELGSRVAMGHCRPHRRGGSDPDRPGREVDRVGVLEP